MAADRWTQERFDEMSWHDNYVHALRLVEGEHGSGDLVLDLDYILEWIRGAEGFEFRILPVSLRFIQVTGLRISLDYAKPGAAMGPFSIEGIERRTEARGRYVAQVWKIVVSWPEGEISFEAQGFEQVGSGPEVVVPRQYLLPQERSGPRRLEG